MSDTTVQHLEYLNSCEAICFGLLKDKDGLVSCLQIKDTSTGFDLICSHWFGVDRFSLSEIIVVSVEQNLSLVQFHMRTHWTLLRLVQL